MILIWKFVEWSSVLFHSFIADIILSRFICCCFFCAFKKMSVHRFRAICVEWLNEKHLFFYYSAAIRPEVSTPILKCYFRQLLVFQSGLIAKVLWRFVECNYNRSPLIIHFLFNNCSYSAVVLFVFGCLRANFIPLFSWAAKMQMNSFEWSSWRYDEMVPVVEIQCDMNDDDDDGDANEKKAKIWFVWWKLARTRNTLRWCVTMMMKSAKIPPHATQRQ